MRKKRVYEQRLLEIDHSTFTPLVFSATRGIARQSTTFYKRLASLLTVKWEQPYNSTLCWDQGAQLPHLFIVTLHHTMHSWRSLLHWSCLQVHPVHRPSKCRGNASYWLTDLPSTLSLCSSLNVLYLYYTSFVVMSDFKIEAPEVDHQARKAFRRQ